MIQQFHFFFDDYMLNCVNQSQLVFKLFWSQIYNNDDNDNDLDDVSVSSIQIPISFILAKKNNSKKLI